jgi:DNA invertase Pin-like site-specific DNA recombinase
MTRHPVAYLRRSNSNKANGNGRISYAVQRAEVLALAARRGDTEPQLIEDWGMSGAAPASAQGGTGRGGRRRAWPVLVAAIEAGEVSALYGYSLSRLARSTRELLDLAALCAAHNVPIRLAKEGDIDGSTPTGRLYLTVLAAMATFEAEVAGERAHDRNAAMLERGAHLGRAPYGHLIASDGRLAPDPVAAPTLKRVLRLYRDLKSPAKVARALNEARIPPPQGGVRGWGDGTVRRILARQPGAEPPATVQGSRAVPSAMFARLVLCHCGARMTPARKNYRNAAGETRVWMGYTCGGARYDPHHRGPRAVPESALLAAAQAEAGRLRLPELAAFEAQAEDRRAEFDARRARLVDALEAGTITRGEAEPRLAHIAAGFAAIEAETQVVEVPALDWAWPAAQLNSVLHTLWERIELDDAGAPARFVWRLPDEYLAAR